MKRELTERQRAFIKGYVSHGDATRAATEAGYAHPQQQQWNLKKDLAEEIEQAVREAFTADAPLALACMRDIMRNGKNEASRARAAADILDRAGFKPVAEHADVTDKRSVEEMISELENRLGPELARQVLDVTLPSGYKPTAERVPEKSRRTLAEQCEERKRINDAAKLKRQQEKQRDMLKAKEAKRLGGIH